mmetsp:Transcript_2442/g.3557  ORF Transcript_2442/g.3557 Transcript_2442/m.3557 type:complete len:316 (+) Transcript_2442:22-969(+)
MIRQIIKQTTNRSILSSHLARNYAKVGVLGAGQMGQGIAYVSSINGQHDVTVVDISDKMLEKCNAMNKKLVQKAVDGGKLDSSDGEAALARITTSTEMNALADCDVVIEAATENTDLKLQLFEQLDQIVKKEGVLATNTSSISITKIAAATSRPDKVIGMHFFNPVPIMRLVEIIRALQTSDETYDLIRDITKSMKKSDCLVKDQPGFAVNRVLCPYINEAIQVLYEGIATVEDIDKTMKLGTNVPMGPLTLADFVGIDTMLSVMEVLHSQLGDDKYRPSPLLRKMVEAGWHGAKTNKGFYEWNKGKIVGPNKAL